MAGCTYDNDRSRKGRRKGGNVREGTGIQGVHIGGEGRGRETCVCDVDKCNVNHIHRIVVHRVSSINSNNVFEEL